MIAFAKAVTQCDQDSLHLLTPSVIQSILSGIIQPDCIKGYLHLSQHIRDPSFHTFLETHQDMLKYIIRSTSKLRPISPSLTSPELVWGWIKSNMVLMQECIEMVKKLLTCSSDVCFECTNSFVNLLLMII